MSSSAIMKAVDLVTSPAPAFRSQLVSSQVINDAVEIGVFVPDELGDDFSLLAVSLNASPDNANTLLAPNNQGLLTAAGFTRGQFYILTVPIGVKLQWFGNGNGDGVDAVISVWKRCIVGA